MFVGDRTMASTSLAGAAAVVTTTTISGETDRTTDHVDRQRALLHDGVHCRQQTHVEHRFLGVEVLRARRVRATRVMMYAVLYQRKHPATTTNNYYYTQTTTSSSRQLEIADFDQ